MIPKLRYRPEIDGLRGVAVLAVVLFHAGFACSGGYVGVDVFFVISGYLISSLIWQDLTSGTFSMVRFWEKRARRILPALVAVTLVSLLVGSCLMFPDDLSELGKATASQVFFAANFHYWLTADYFAGAAEEKPLLHTWSLAVEEQFYLIVPWLLYGIYGLQFRDDSRRLWVVRWLLIVLAFFSFGLSLYGVRYFPASTFYLLHARAWELLVGTLVAFLPALPDQLELGQLKPGQLEPGWGLGRFDARDTQDSTPSVLRELLSIAGALLILVPIFYYDARTPFPGLAAVPPCLGAALIIWSDCVGAQQRLTQVGRLLAQPYLVSIGLISYSLYLWHWPLFAFAKQLSLEPLSLAARSGLLGCSVIAAILSWKFVETPFRHKVLGAQRLNMFCWAGSAMALLGAVGALLWSTSGLPQRFTVAALAKVAAKSDMDFVHQMTVEDVSSGRLLSLGAVSQEANSVPPSPALLVWGDSHAMAALPAVDQLLREKGLMGQAAMHSSTLPVRTWYVPTEWGLGERALEFSDKVIEHVAEYKISDVLLVAYWRGYGLEQETRAAEFEAALLATVSRLQEVGARSWVLLDVPVHGFDIPKAVARPLYSQDYIASLCSTPESLPAVGPDAPALHAKLLAAGARVLDPKPMFLNASGEYYRVHSDGTPLYRDTHHLTTVGAKLMLLPFLRNEMSRLGEATPPDQSTDRGRSIAPITPQVPPQSHPIFQ